MSVVGGDAAISRIGARPWYSAKMEGKKNIKLGRKHLGALRRLGVVLCYLHGSIASGTSRENSDADIAVLFEKAPADSIEATAAVHQALSGLVPGREIDVAILNEASPLLRQIVASTGKLLYARSPDDALRFELRAMHDYEYSRHVVRLGQELALKRAGI